MNASIHGIIDHMFRDTVENAETKALHEELLNNCLEHYDDLIARGMSETEAIDAVVESLKGMKEVIDEYPKKNSVNNEEQTFQKTTSSVTENHIENESPEKTVEKPTEYTYDPAVVNKLKTDLKNCDLKIGISNDEKHYPEGNQTEYSQNESCFLIISKIIHGP